MDGPAKNRPHPYESGWLTQLLQMGVASEKALREAHNRVAQAAVDKINEWGKRRWILGVEEERGEEPSLHPLAEHIAGATASVVGAKENPNTLDIRAVRRMPSSVVDFTDTAGEAVR